MTRSIARILATALAVLGLAAFMRADDQPYVALANQLIGHYEGVAGPDNKLLVLIQPARPEFDARNFSVTIQGKYNGNNVSFVGALSLQPQGETARLIWATKRSDCQVDIHPEGDGFIGVTLKGACNSAFQNPISGTWEFQTEPGSFRVRSVETGETLRFRKVRSTEAPKS